MDKIEQMENVLKEYEKMQETLKNLEGDKKRAVNKKEKAEERYNEAEAEFGKNTVNEYEEAVLEEYKKLIQQSEQEFNSVEESIKTGQKDLENMSTDNNIRTVTQGVMEIEKQIRSKELQLQRSQLELTEYYQKEDKEGKIPQDFYNEQDKLKKEIKELTEKKEKFENFLDKLKEGREKLIEDGRYMEVNNQESANNQPTNEQPENTQPINGQTEVDPMTFMNQTITALDALLQMEPDENSKDAIKSSATQSIEIYRKKVQEMLANDKNAIIGNPEILQKMSEIGRKIENLETKYNLKEQTTQQQASGQQTPAQQTPAQQTSGQQAPGQQTPAQQTSSQQAPNQQEKKTPLYEITIGKMAIISLDGKEYEVENKIVKDGVNLTDLQIKEMIYKTTGIDKGDLKDINSLIHDGILDSTVINVIYNSEISESQKQDVIKGYVKDCYKAKFANKAPEGKIYYDQEDLAKTSIIARIMKKEVNQDEKMTILDRAQKAARYGIAEIEGEYKPDFKTRLVNLFTRQKTKKLLSTDEIQEVATTYNTLRDKGETSKISQKEFRDRVELTKEQKKELGQLYKSQTNQESSKSDNQKSTQTEQTDAR